MVFGLSGLFGLGHFLLWLHDPSRVVEGFFSTVIHTYITTVYWNDAYCYSFLSHIRFLSAQSTYNNYGQNYYRELIYYKLTTYYYNTPSIIVSSSWTVFISSIQSNTIFHSWIYCRITTGRQEFGFFFSLRNSSWPWGLGIVHCSTFDSKQGSSLKKRQVTISSGGKQP